MPNIFDRSLGVMISELGRHDLILALSNVAP